MGALAVHLTILILTSHFLLVSCLRLNRTRVRSKGVVRRPGAHESLKGWEDGDFEFYYRLVDKINNKNTTVVASTREVQNSTSFNSTTEISVLDNDTTSTEDPRARIIGGEPAVSGEFKYQLSIRLGGPKRHHCGAALTSVDGEQLAITAAHCVRGLFPDDITLVAGDLTRSDISGHEQERSIVDIQRHPDFEFVEGVPSYDLALLFLDKPFEENSYVGTISIAPAGQVTKGKVVVSGWGDQNPRYSGRPSDRLMKVEVPVVEYEVCKKSYSVIVSEFYEHFFCAGYMQKGVYKDSCQGDSGGPVRSEQGYLAGIVSWGAGCGIPMFPGVNTNVGYFNDFITDRVQKYKSDSSNEDGSEEKDKESGEGDSSREEEEGEDNEAVAS